MTLPILYFHSEMKFYYIFHSVITGMSSMLFDVNVCDEPLCRSIYRRLVYIGNDSYEVLFFLIVLVFFFLKPFQ